MLCFHLFILIFMVNLFSNHKLLQL